MRRPLLGLAVCFGLGCLLADGQGTPREALRLACLAACALGLAAWAGLGRAALLALAGAALALGAAAAAVERLQVESQPLHRRLVDGTLGDGAQRLTGTLAGHAEERLGRLAFVLEAEAILVRGRLEPTAGRVRVEVAGEAARKHLLDADRVAAWMTLRPAGEAGDALVAFGYCKSARLVEPLPDSGQHPVRRAVAGWRARARRARAFDAAWNRARPGSR